MITDNSIAQLKLFLKEMFQFNVNDLDFGIYRIYKTMMENRLEIVSSLLKEDGVFFTSLDANQIAECKILLTEIFKNENFEGLITWRRRHNQPNDKTKMIGLVSGYILSFSKDSVVYKQTGVGKVELTAKFSNPDNDVRGDWASKPWKAGSDQSGSKYQIKLDNGKILEEEWMGEEDTFKKLLKDKRIYFPDGGNGAPRKKYFKSERLEEGQCATNWWGHDVFGHNQGANDLLTNLFGSKNKFSNPKPIELIKGIANISNLQSGRILDFFAGSGTTGHSIINLNKEDGGNRAGKSLLIFWNNRNKEYISK